MSVAPRYALKLRKLIVPYDVGPSLSIFAARALLHAAAELRARWRHPARGRR